MHTQLVDQDTGVRYAVLGTEDSTKEDLFKTGMEDTTVFLLSTPMYSVDRLGSPHSQSHSGSKMLVTTISPQGQLFCAGTCHLESRLQDPHGGQRELPPTRGLLPHNARACAQGHINPLNAGREQWREQ